MMTRKSLRSSFFVLIPIILVFSAAIYTKTTNRSFAYSACTPESFSGNIDLEETTAFFDRTRLQLPQVAGAEETTPVLGVASPSERWIEVDLSDQRLKAWEGDQLFMETAVSTGLPWYPTPEGEFRIWVKLRSTKMEGGQGKNYYYLPNVPFVMYFENDATPGWRGYGLHGTYWHDDFGNRRSHGCVNLPTSEAEKLYYWAAPELAQGKYSVFSSANNQGTRVVIHD